MRENSRVCTIKAVYSLDEETVGVGVVKVQHTISGFLLYIPVSTIYQVD